MGKEIVGISHLLTVDPDGYRLCRACKLAINS